MVYHMRYAHMPVVDVQPLSAGYSARVRDDEAALFPSCQGPTEEGALWDLFELVGCDYRITQGRD